MGETMHNEWVDVNNKLPKTTGEYIVWYFHSGNNEVGLLYFNGDCWSGEIGASVTHWRELPEAPNIIKKCEGCDTTLNENNFSIAILEYCTKCATDWEFP
jgi:hypothetical protein